MGNKELIDVIMKYLNIDMTIVESEFMYFALGNIESEEGFMVMEDYLFHGA